MTKLVRLSEESWKTLFTLSQLSKTEMKTLLDQWLSEIQSIMNDELVIDASKIEVNTYRKGKTLAVITVISPEHFSVKTIPITSEEDD